MNPKTKKIIAATGAELPVLLPFYLFAFQSFSSLLYIWYKPIYLRGTVLHKNSFNLFSLVTAEGDPNHGAALIKELENLIKNFEYTFDPEGDQIFPNNNIKQDIVSEYKSSNYNINDLNYELLGFKIIASDIRIQVDRKKIDDTKTRIDIPLLLAKDIKVSNGGLINLSYDAVDLGSVYGVYNRATDKMIVHVPVSIATKYL